MKTKEERLRKGWIASWRMIDESWLWKNNEQLACWIKILHRVNHSYEKVEIKGHFYHCQRGESVMSLESWAEVFGKGWTRKRVTSFFTKLERDEMLDTKRDNRTTHLRVCNYSLYQDIGKAKGTAKGTAEGQQRDTIKQCNHSTNQPQDNETSLSNNKEQNQDFAEPPFEYENHYPTLEDEKALEKLESEKVKPKPKSKFPFEIFWGLYPLKKGKAQAEKTWKRMSEANKELAINMIPKYIASQDPNFLHNGSTYLNQKIWEDDLSPRQESAPTRQISYQEQKAIDAEASRDMVGQMRVDFEIEKQQQGLLK